MSSTLLTLLVLPALYRLLHREATPDRRSLHMHADSESEPAMTWILTKYLVTAALVVLITEVAKRSDKLGGLIAALPLVSILTLVWLYLENQPAAKIASFAGYTFWYVVPTLPMFLAIPWLLPRIGFWPALGASILISGISLGLFALLVKRFGIELL